MLFRSGDGGIDRYVVRVSRGTCTVLGGAQAEAVERRDATITCEGADFLKLATGHLSAITGVLRGQLKVKGDRAKALHFASVLDIPSVRRHLPADEIGRARDGAFTPALRDALLQSLYASGSDLLIVPMQDVFGWTDRINQPATVNDINWTWRLPWPVDLLAGCPEALEVSARLRAWGRDHAR